MSRTKEYSSLGLKVSIVVPDNPFALGSQDYAIYESGIDSVIYRAGSGLPQFREELVDAVAQAVGYTRPTAPVLDKEGKIKKDDEGNDRFTYTNSEQEEFNLILAKVGKEASAFQDIANSVSTNLKFDATAPERSAPAPKNPPKSIYATADALIAAGKADATAAALSSILSKTVNADRESLARAIHEDALNELRKAKNKWTS
jgi:hypothetical protein